MNHSSKKCIHTTDQLKIPASYPLTPLTLPNLSPIKKGVQCIHCGSFDLKRKFRHYTCSCGKTESFKGTILTNINDFCLLLHCSHFTRKDIMNYLNDEISCFSLSKILSNHFTKERTFYNILYQNPYSNQKNSE